LQEDKLSFPLISWLSIIGDTINSAYDAIENGFEYLTATSFALQSESVTLTSGLPTFTVANGSLYTVGQDVIGSGIPAATKILSIVGNLITLTANATSTGASTLTFVPTDVTITNGILLYDTTNNVYVGMQAGALVKFTTTAYP